MRSILVEENTVWPSRLLLVEGAVSIEDDKIPILREDPNQRLIGKITDIRREGNTITGEVTFFPGYFVDMKHVTFSACLSNLEIEECRIIKGRLRAVSLASADPARPLSLTEIRDPDV